MVTTTHHMTHVPAPVVNGVHIIERVFGAVFFTVLAPVAFALAIVAGLALAIGLGALL
ncbi:MAG: hypothetical protein WEB90_05760 [Gemmatimonadota bacterium]